MSGMTKSERLQEMKRLYIQRAYSDIEMAERLGVDRTTVYRDRVELTVEYPVESDAEGRYHIARSKLISEIKVNLHEALTLYLAARKTSRQTRFHQPHVASALEKLATTLRQPMTERLLKAADVLLKQEKDPERIKILEILAQAWVEQKKVRIRYQRLRSEGFVNHTISPYLIEPSIWSDSTYVIALSDVTEKLIAFRVDRIETAVLSGEEFEIPADFDDQQLLKHAWGIWYGDKEPVTVKLRFSPTVTRRVKESIWHPLENVTDTEDGGCLWSADVAEWREMLPWVRGWGAECEVLKPKELREALLGETKRLMNVYGIVQGKDTGVDRILRLWGKTSKGNTNSEDFHPVVFHMLDVGNIARELLSNHASPRWRRALSNALNADAEKLADWLPYFVALHDIGKVSAAFQSLNKEQLARLRREGFTLVAMDILHAHITQIYLEESLPQIFEETSSKIQLFSESLGGHHGRFAHPDEEIKSGRRKLSVEFEEWKSLRQMVDIILQKELLKHETKSLADPVNISTGIMAFTGFMILCDWLGSDERYFPPAPNTGMSAYLEKSRQRAAQATRDSGLLASAWSDASADVESLFADLIPLRSLQLAVDEIPENLIQSPSLTIIEAPTGEGKTEAALALAHRIARITGTDELYYALPTMATSNQIFERLQVHLQKRLRLDVSAKLVHGQAFLIEEDLRAASISPLENGDGKSDVNESISWFNSKKRALIAPFGVGTIDQAELAALNVKHAALRMMGLVGKVIIVDEVHAYDTYMTTVIERLLRWLASMHTSVILLSATLPKSRRQRLAQAYGMKVTLNDEQANAYPSLLVVSENGTHQTSPSVWQPNRTIELHELHFDDENAQEKAQWLLDAVSNGGCACWITNTVKRTQHIFDILRKNVPPDVDLQLLHSQFPLEERQKREDDLKHKYGRDGNRPPKGIVVGTQVLEQSLDLDFDVMVSDLAPIDLLLQRAGRLHRHDRARPAAHPMPRLWLNFEMTTDGELKLGTDRTIYDEFIMRQTYKTLAERPQIQLPNDYRTLIEAVYADQPPLENDPLYDAWLELQSKQKIAFGEARERLLPEPHPRDSFAKSAAMRVTFEEDENRADWVVAKTRLGEQTLNIIPLEREDEFVILANTNEKITMHAEAPRDAQRGLLRRHLRISNQTVIDEIQKDVEKNATKLFTQSALLKGFYPLWLKGGKREFKTKRGMLRITLDPQLGLVIEKESKANDTEE